MVRIVTRNWVVVGADIGIRVRFNVLYTVFPTDRNEDVV